MSNQGQQETWALLSEKVQAQSWPASCLYVVATPIGNLGDLSLRAWQTLLRCDIIAAEDTRASRQLLQAWGVATPLMAAHRHNEAAAAQAIIERLHQGERVALVSDAGAPAVSDPGARIVRAVRDAGFQVVPIPGASAVITALMGSGATSDENPAFCFSGFAPSKAQARRKWLQQWAQQSMPVLFFESPHRVLDTAQDLALVCADRQVTIARELSKRFEQIHTLAADQVVEWLQADSHRQQGEFVLILHPATPSALDDEDIPADTQAWMRALLEHMSVRDAARLASKVSGISRDVLYNWALAQKA